MYKKIQDKIILILSDGKWAGRAFIVDQVQANRAFYSTDALQRKTDFILSDLRSSGQIETKEIGQATLYRLTELE